MMGDGDSLRELNQFGTPELLQEFRLPDQDHLEQEVLAGIDVRQEPQFLQGFDRQILRLIDDQNALPSGTVFGDQEGYQLLEGFRGIHAKRLLAERGQHPGRNVAQRAMRVRDEPDCEVPVDAFEKSPQQSGLAGAYLAGDDAKAGLSGETVFEQAQRDRVLVAEKQELRIRQ
ncbi:MAG TPA: hypothetical protein VGM43_26605 [Bryobacteraceae bacterium]